MPEIRQFKDKEYPFVVKLDGKWRPTRVVEDEGGEKLYLNPDSNAWERVRDETATEFVTGAARTLGQGVGMKWADEMEASARALPGMLSGQTFSEGYNEAIGPIRENIEQFGEQHPYLAPALEFGGAALSGGYGAAKMLAGKAGTSLLSRYGMPAVVGGLEGAVAGAGAADGGSRGQGAVQGGAAGAVGGPALAVGGRTARRWIIDPIRARLGGGQNVGREYISRALQRDRVTPQQASQTVRQMGPGAALVDVGPNVRTVGEVAAQTPGRGMAIAEEFVDERRLGQFDRIMKKLDDAAGPLGRDVLERIEESPTFRASLDQMVPITDDMLRFMSRPSIRRAWAKAQKLAAEMDETLPSFEQFQKMTRDPNARATGIETRVLHWLKKGLDDVLEPKRDARGFITSNYGKNETAAMEGTRREFRSLVKGLNPEYGASLDRISADKRVDDALETGYALVRGGKGPEDVRIAMKRFNDPRQQRALQQGMIRGIAENLESAAGVGDDVSKRVGRLIPRLRVAFGDKGDDLARQLQAEVKMMRTDNRIAANSATARRETARDDMAEGMTGEQLGFFGNLFSGNIGGAAASAARGAQRAAATPPEAAVEETARILFALPPDQLQRVLAMRQPLGGRALEGAGYGILGGASVGAGALLAP